MNRHNLFNNTTILPDGWRWVRLGEVCEFEYGASLPSYSRQNGAVPVYGSNGIVGGHDKPITNGPTIIIGRKGSIGEVHYSHNPCWPIDTTYYVDKTKLAVDLIWLTFLLRSLNLRELNKSTAVPGLNREDVYAQKIPLPPLSEQKRIAAILNEQIEAVEKARAATEAQREAAKALPRAQARKIFESPDSRSWTTRQLGEIFAVKSGDFLPAKTMNAAGSYPVYGGNGINGYHDSFMFEEPQIVIGRVGALCGCIHVSQPKSWITDNALYISEKKIPFDDVYMSNYLIYLDLNKLSNSMAQPLISGKLLYPIRVRLPQISEQKRIATILTEQLAEAEKLNESVAGQLNTIKSLPASLLRQAFSGEL